MIGAEGIQMKEVVNSSKNARNEKKEAAKGFDSLFNKLHSKLDETKSQNINGEVAEETGEQQMNLDGKVIALPGLENTESEGAAQESADETSQQPTEDILGVVSVETMQASILSESAHAGKGIQEETSEKAVAIAATALGNDLQQKLIAKEDIRNVMVMEQTTNLAKNVSEEGKAIMNQAPQTTEHLNGKLDLTLVKEANAQSQQMPAQEAPTQQTNKVVDSMQFLSMQQQVTEASAKTPEATTGDKQLPQVRASHLAEDLKGLFKQQFTQFQNKDKSQIRVMLNPEHLGQLDILISEKQGKMNAQLLTTTGAAKDMLEMQMHVLKMTLSNQGITVDKIEVAQQNTQMQDSMQNQSDSKQQKQQFDQQQQKQQKQLDQQEVVNSNTEYIVTAASRYEQREYSTQVNYVV